MGWFSDQWKDLVNAFYGNDYLRDYAHAAKTFQTNGYQNAPKYKFLFHVYFGISPSTGVEPLPEYSLLVRDIKLPAFKFDVKEYNQYNRKRLVQTAINYDPITITFHDDNANAINNLWYAYYTYYYADATQISSPVESAGRGAVGSLRSGGGAYDNGAFNPLRDTYVGDVPTNSQTWGYIGETNLPGYSNQFQKEPFFNYITIYGFEQHNFFAYTLINPMITDFAHDTYNYDEGNGTMKNTMTLKYETVLYNYGYIDGMAPDETVPNFGSREYYDRQLSPLLKPGANGYVLGRGGLLDSAGGIFRNMADDPIGSIIRGSMLYKAWKNRPSIKDQLLREIEVDIINNGRANPNPSRNNRFYFPAYGGQTPNPYNSSGSPTTGGYTGLSSDVPQTAGVQVPDSLQTNRQVIRGPIE